MHTAGTSCQSLDELSTAVWGRVTRGSDLHNLICFLEDYLAQQGREGHHNHRAQLIYIRVSGRDYLRTYNQSVQRGGIVE